MRTWIALLPVALFVAGVIVHYWPRDE
jgi:hypothetical protein